MNPTLLLHDPSSLMAVVISTAQKMKKADLPMAAARVSYYFNSLRNDCISTADYAGTLKNKSLKKLVSGTLGEVHAVSSVKLGQSTTVYKLRCSEGTFMMKLETDSENRINITDFMILEQYIPVSQAA